MPVLEAETFDHALPFLIFTTMGVVGMIAVFCWIFAMAGWSGPLGLLKGGWA